MESTVYIVGGQTLEHQDLSVDTYDIQSNVWTPVSPMQTVRVFPGADSIRNILYVTGGHQGT